MTNEQNPEVIQLDRHDEFTAAIAAQPQYESRFMYDRLKEGGWQMVDLRPDTPMATVVDEVNGTKQDLFAVIRAGNEHFGVLGTEFTKDGQTKKALIVTHFGGKEDGNASMIGILENNSEADEELNRVRVGRLDAPHYSNEVSKNHFTIVLGADGKIRVGDESSTNGTEVLFAKKAPSDVSDEQVASKGLRAMLKRRKAKKDQQLATKNPLDDPQTWAASTDNAITYTIRAQPGSLFRYSIKNLRAEAKDYRQ